MVSRSDIQILILGTSLLTAMTCSYINDYYQKNKPAPDIPVQSWDKYVKLQKEAGKDY